MNFNKPKLKYWTAQFVLLLCHSWTVRGDIRVSEDGGYSNVIVKISDSLDMHKCGAIIAGLKVKSFTRHLSLILESCFTLACVCLYLAPDIGAKMLADCEELYKHKWRKILNFHT